MNSMSEKECSIRSFWYMIKMQHNGEEL